MKLHSLLCSLLLIACGAELTAQPAIQSETAQQMSKMRDYITANMKESSGSSSGVAFRSAMQSANELTQIDQFLANNDFRGAINQAKGAINRAEDPTLKKLWETLATQLEQDLQVFQKQLITQINDTLAEGGKLLTSTKKPEEIDSYLEKLYSLQEQRNQLHWLRPVQRHFQKIDQAIGFAQQWQDLLSSASDGDMMTAKNIANNLRNYPHQGRLVSRSEMNKLFKVYDKAEETDTKELAEAIRSTLKNAGELIQKAQKDTELDPVFDTLAELQGQRPPNLYHMPALNRLYQQLDQSVGAVSQFQNYLAQLEAGNSQAAQNELRNFSHQNARARLVPQSWIASKMKQDTSDTVEVDKIMTALTPANLSEGVEQIQKIANNDHGPLRHEYNMLINDIRHLLTIQSIEKTRGPVEAYNRMGQPGSPHRWRNRIATTALLMQTDYAAKILGVKIEATKEGALESTLSNLLTQFAKDKNWPGMARVLELIRNGQFYGTTSPDVVNGELAAARHYLVGEQMEKLGQKDEAIRYYVETLKHISDRLPLKEAADKIAKLKGQ